MRKHTELQGKLRLRILDMHYKAGSGHIGCSLSCIDIMIAVLKFFKKPEDTFVLSKGHAASALYTILNEIGEISDQDINSFYTDGTRLPAHPAPLKYSAIPFATGSLGHGLPIATGIAKANQLMLSKASSYVLMSDGETNEGTSWEAAHFAVANKLDNLIIFIDKNGLQGIGNTKDILGDTASKQTWESIGFEVVEINGHDITKIVEMATKLRDRQNGLPKLIIANTVKGKGVSYMENKMEWHYLPMSELQYKEAIDNVNSQYMI